MTHADLLARIAATRRRLAEDGPPRTRPHENDFERVSVPAPDCDSLRDLLVRENAASVIEIGLAYGSSALAIGEALVRVGADSPSHLVIDPMQESAYFNAGWESICAAGLDGISTLVLERSQIALPRLVAEGFVADAAYVDGSHMFHLVFVDLFFLRQLVRPGGLVMLDDHQWPSVATAARYYETNLGWAEVPDAFTSVDPRYGQPRGIAYRLPDPPVERAFSDFIPF